MENWERAEWPFAVSRYIPECEKLVMLLIKNK